MFEFFFKNLNLLIILLPFLAGLLLIGGFLFFKKKKIKKYAQVLDFLLLEVKVPHEEGSDEEKMVDPREMLKVFCGNAEQFFSSLYGIYKDDLYHKIFGQDYLTFEIVSTSKEIVFYVGAPKYLISILEKQIHSFWPSAQVKIVSDYNIFHPDCKVACAEFQLFKSYFYPIKTYAFLTTEPLNNLTTALSKLSEREGTAIQILISPARPNWASPIRSFIKSLKEGKSQTFPKVLDIFGNALHSLFTSSQTQKEPPMSSSSPSQAPQINPESLQALESKASKAGFKTNIRIIVTSPTENSAKMHLSNIISAFSQFNHPELNGFKPKTKRVRKKILYPFIFRLPTRTKMILSSEELATLYHFPNKLIETPNISWVLAKSAPSPTYLPEEGLILGKSIFRDIKKLVRIKEEDMRRHIYIIGKSGTGKSTLLENMVLQDIKNKKGVCFIDPHGDAIESILPKIPKERAEDVILFDPGDLERPIGLNLFEFKSPHQKDFLIQETINMLYKLYDPGKIGIMGPRFEHWFRNAALTLMADPKGATIIEIPRIFTDRKFLEDKLKHIKDPLVLDFWNKEMAQTSDFHKSEILGWFIAKFGAFMTNDIMRNVLGQTKSAFDLRDIMDSQKILLVNLSKGKLGELNSQLLGMIFITKIQAGAMSRVDTPEEQRKDFHLYVDEFQNFSTDSFATILSEARKYHLCLITANQYIAQLEERIREAVFGNIGTLITFRVGPADAEFLEKEFLPVFTVHDLINIDKFHAYIRLLIDNKASEPFSIATLKPEFPENKEVGEAIRNLSRLKHGKERKLVEEKIFERFSEIESPEDLPEEFKEFLEKK